MQQKQKAGKKDALKTNRYTNIGPVENEKIITLQEQNRGKSGGKERFERRIKLNECRPHQQRGWSTPSIYL